MLLIVMAPACSSDDTDGSTSTVGSTTDAPTTPTSVGTTTATTVPATPPPSTTNPAAAPMPSTEPEDESEPPVEATLPADGEPEVLGPIGSVDLDLSTDEGSVQIGDAEVPPLIPADFPLPDDLTVQVATEAGEQAGFSGVTDLELDELVDLYRTGLVAIGYEIIDEQVTGAFAVFRFASDGANGEIAVSSAPGGGRSLLVTYGS